MLKGLLPEEIVQHGVDQTLLGYNGLSHPSIAGNSGVLPVLSVWEQAITSDVACCRPDWQQAWHAAG